MLAHKIAQSFKHGPRLWRKRVAARGNAHVTFGQGIFFQARQHAQHAHICVFFNDLAQQIFVPRRAHLIEHHSRKMQTRFKGCHAVHKGRRGAGHLGAVDAENDGAGQHACKLCRGARTGYVHAVKKPPVAFNDAKHLGAASLRLGFVHGVHKERLELLWPKHVGVKVGGGPPRSHGQPGGVDVVRPFFESLYRMPLRGKCVGKPQR